MIAADILARIGARLGAALAPPVGDYTPLCVDGRPVAWLDAARAARLLAFSDVFERRGNTLAFTAGLASPDERTGALVPIVAALAAEGALTAWRNERYAAAADPGSSPAWLMERAAARYFGIHTYAAHVNGLVARHDGTAMWIARRSPRKAIDPGLLDNLVGGGIAAGTGVADTVVKEAWEEAGLPDAVARGARPAGVVHICREQPDGLQRETIYVHDLVLPAHTVPEGQDGEVTEHRLVSFAEAARLVANDGGDDVVTADASLVIVDCLIRHGEIAPDTPGYLALDALRHPATWPAARR